MPVRPALATPAEVAAVVREANAANLAALFPAFDQFPASVVLGGQQGDLLSARVDQVFDLVSEVAAGEVDRTAVHDKDCWRLHTTCLARAVALTLTIPPGPDPLEET
jgi:hypothetical protein